MDWKPGLILRIKDYKFEDDNSTRDKYLIVLFTNNQQAYLIHSLTTSRNNPGITGLKYGCSVHNRLPYFYFPVGQVIGDQRFSFDKETFIFFSNNVRKESFEKLEAASKKLFGLISLGLLNNEELKRIIKCALKSNLLPKQVEQELLIFKESL